MRTEALAAINRSRRDKQPHRRRERHHVGKRSSNSSVSTDSGDSRAGRQKRTLSPRGRVLEGGVATGGGDGEDASIGSGGGGLSDSAHTG